MLALPSVAQLDATPGVLMWLPDPHAHRWHHSRCRVQLAPAPAASTPTNVQHAPAFDPRAGTISVPSLSRQPTRAAVQAPSSNSPGFTHAFPQAENAASFPSACWDQLGLDALLTPEERALRDRVRAFMVRVL